MLEILVHIAHGKLADNYVIYPVTFSEKLVQRVSLPLPADWQVEPPPLSTKVIGDSWAKGMNSAVLEVPSAIVAEEANFILNPLHADFGSIVISDPLPCRFDPRLY